MNTVRVLHTADLHIGAQCNYLGVDSVNRRYETLETFRKIITLCNENKIELLLIAGDLFDSNHIEEPFIDGVFDGFKALKDTKVIIALGNHDPLTADSPFSYREKSDNVYVLSSSDDVITFDDLHCRVYGASFDGVYSSGSPRFSLIPKKDDYINLMVIHGEARADFKGNYRPITPEFVKMSGMDYIALGHVHKRSEIQSIGTTSLAYCGCPEGQGFDESGEKGVYIGNIAKGNIDLEFVPTAARTHYCIDVDITGSSDICETVKEAIIKTDDNYSRNFFRVTLTGKRSLGRMIDTAEITAKLSSLVSFIKIKDKTKVNVDLEALAEEKTLKGYFTALMLSKIDTAEESEKEKLLDALDLGLNCFDGEVTYSEN